jgi:hypothetical protein
MFGAAQNYSQLKNKDWLFYSRLCFANYKNQQV